MKPWELEHDYEEFKYKGYPCLIRRTDLGNLCGYVGLDKTHPCYGKHYDEIAVNCHGGLTFSDYINPDIEPMLKGKESIWWLGFDCAHCFDIVPSIGLVLPDATYKDLAYVRNEIKQLVDQLREIQDVEEAKRPWAN